MIEHKLGLSHTAIPAPGAHDGAGDRGQGGDVQDSPDGELDLAFLHSPHGGALLSGLQVTIADHAGTPILSSIVDVPTLLHASLAQGTYTVIARHGNTIKLYDVEIVRGKTERVLFEWNA